MAPDPTMTEEELWRTVLDRVGAGAIRPEYASAYWFKELRAVLDHAEAHVNIHKADAVVRNLRELQARCENIIGVLAPEERAGPRLVVAA
jgi:hypothetical protein